MASTPACPGARRFAVGLPLGLHALLGEQLLVEASLARGVRQDGVHFLEDGAEAPDEVAEQAIGLLELAPPEMDVAPQERRLVGVGRVGETHLRTDRAD